MHAESHRPVYLLSGLIKCGCCGGGFSKINAAQYGCSNARNRGTCDNRLGIRRNVIEASVLSGLGTHLMQPDLVKEFIAEYHAELNRRSAGRDRASDERKHELAKVERQIRAIIEAIKDGMRTSGMKEELEALEAHKLELTHLVASEPPPAPRLHPN